MLKKRRPNTKTKQKTTNEALNEYRMREDRLSFLIMVDVLVNLMLKTCTRLKFNFSHTFFFCCGKCLPYQSQCECTHAKNMIYDASGYNIA